MWHGELTQWEAVAITNGGTRCGGRSPARWRRPRQSKGDAPSWWRRPQQAYLGATAWGRGEEGHEAGAAEELGDEDSGMALHLGAVDPLQRVGRIDTSRARQGGSKGARRVRSEASGVGGVLSLLYGSMRPGRPNALNKALSLGGKNIIDAMLVLSSLLVLY
jgi:hypothetical protein